MENPGLLSRAGPESDLPVPPEEPSNLTEISRPPTAAGPEGLSQRIDFLRGAFSIWVLIAHSYFLFMLLKGSRPASAISVEGWFSTLLNSGYLGVMGFFFLSGFCIQWSVEKTLTTGDGSHFKFGHYLKARFTRLAPLFYIGLFLAVATEWLCSTLPDRPPLWEFPGHPSLAIIATLVFLQGIFGTYGCYGASWSITNEAIYYVAWPLALKVLRRNVLRAFLISSMLALLLAGIFYVLWKHSGKLDDPLRISLWTIPMSSLMWFVGALCRSRLEAISKSPVFAFLQKWWWPLTVLWVIWTNSLVVFGFSFFQRTLLNPFSYVIVPLVVMANWRVPTSPRFTSWLADVSYPLYLMHGPILMLVASCLITGFPALPPLLVAVTASVAALAISGTAGVWAERTFMNLRRKALRP